MLFHDPETALQITLLALVADALIGDPPLLWRRLPHPVAAFGRLAEWCEGRWNRPSLPALRRRIRGAAAALLLIALAALAGLLLAGALSSPYGWLAEGLAASVLLAYRGLTDRVGAVAAGLRTDLEAGRDAVRHLVGRDVARLDDHGIARAAVESLAENFSDAVLAPCFWLLLFGLPGLFAYKAVNTLDSMWGYRSPRFEDFGRLAARLDDFANLAPARLTALLFLATAALFPAADAGAAVRVLRRDARRHRSPNAGYPEAALAGALGFRLSGPRSYGQQRCAEPWIGCGRAALDADDIERARAFVRTAFLLLCAILAALGALTAGRG